MPLIQDRKLTHRLRNALTIGTFWAVMAGFQSVYEYSILLSWDLLPAHFSLWILFQSIVLPVFFAGLLLGLFLLSRINDWLRKYAYGKALLLLLITSSLLYFVTSFTGSVIYNAQHLEVGILDEAIRPRVIEYLTGFENLKNYLFWVAVVLVTLLGLQINDKYGPGNFRAFLSGKYFRPKTEDRIFMFLDLRASTSIAEQLSEMAFFEFIRDFYRDATTGILETEGEIYQYVGDEIVVSWRLPRGLKNNNCLRSFFIIDQSVRERASHYESAYGIVPSFKAGFHCGTVVTGEIGVLKKDIAYSGDVLNTASRIQSRCNDFGVDLLLSGVLAEKLPLAGSPFRVRALGPADLRGKAETLELFTVDMD